MDIGTLVSIEKAKKIMEKKPTKVIDVRDPVSYRNGTVLDAVNVPLRNISSLLKFDKKTHIIIYGDKENQKAAVNYVIQLGFNNVYRLPEHPSVVR